MIGATKITFGFNFLIDKKVIIIKERTDIWRHHFLAQMKLF